MFVYVVLTLIILIVFMILPLKAFFGRERPTRITSVFRLCNMRDLEHGKAMPSGDSAAGAYFLTIYMLIFNQYELLMICLPLVCLGRVYVHCHWIGDTIIGSLLGFGVAWVFFS